MAKKLTANEEAAAINAGVNADDPSLNETVAETKEEVGVELDSGVEGPILQEADAEAKAGRPELLAAVNRVRARVKEANEAIQGMEDLIGGMDFDDDDEDEMLGDSD